MLNSGWIFYSKIVVQNEFLIWWCLICIWMHVYLIVMYILANAKVNFFPYVYIIYIYMYVYFAKIKIWKKFFFHIQNKFTQFKRKKSNLPFVFFFFFFSFIFLFCEMRKRNGLHFVVYYRKLWLAKFLNNFSLAEYYLLYIGYL